MSLVNYNHKYINGYWNFSQTGVNKTTYKVCKENSEGFNGSAGYNTTATVNGDIMYYTGVTAVNNAEANLGFILVSPRTGKVTYYTCQGAEETSAMAAAQGLVQNLGYKATFPTIINVEGVETYFMVMKDGAGLIQRYALCQMSNYVNVVQAETMEQALQLYKEKIGLVKKPVVTENELTGVIADLYTVQVDGNTNYLFTLEGSADLYKSSIANNYYQVKMKPGDKVVIKFKDVEGVKTVTSIEL